MPIKNNTKKLKENIINTLKKANIRVPVGVDVESGDVVTEYVSFVSTKSEGQLVKFEDANKPKYGEVYSSNNGTGIEKIAESISNEVLSYITENANVNLKERLNVLENDYNALIVALNTAGSSFVVPPLSPIGTALTTIATAGGGISRTTKTNALIKKNEETDIG